MLLSPSKRATLWLGLIATLLVAEPYSVGSEAPSSSFLTIRIQESSLIGRISNPHIHSFDLSPDGKSVALLVVSGTQVGAPLWLVTEDVSTQRVEVLVELGPSVVSYSGFESQVSYAGGQHYIVVQDTQQIRVFDANSLQFLRAVAPPPAQASLVPLSILAASSSNVLACVFGSPSAPDAGVYTTPAQIVAIDLASGNLIATWQSDDVPQSISPMGNLVAVSSPHVRRGVLPISVFDINGHRIAEYDGGFFFRKVDDTGRAMGRVKGLFLSEKELLLSPDGTFDRSGHRSGSQLRVVTVASSSGGINMGPPNFGPTGDLAVSADHKTIVVGSWDISAWIMRHDYAIPSDSKPELFVFRRDHGLRLETSIPLQQVGGLRISADGSVLAAGGYGSIMVVKTNAPGQQP